jgi:hypothetical protein
VSSPHLVKELTEFGLDDQLVDLCVFAPRGVKNMVE